MSEPLMIESQGSFAAGGTVITSAGQYNPRPDAVKNKTSNSFMDVFQASVKAGGQTLHGDHATVFYQIPVNAKKTAAGLSARRGTIDAYLANYTGWPRRI